MSSEMKKKKLLYNEWSAYTYLLKQEITPTLVRSVSFVPSGFYVVLSCSKFFWEFLMLPTKKKNNILKLNADTCVLKVKTWWFFKL